MQTPATRRYDSLDFLRGSMLIMMTLDHLLWSAFRSIGYVSDITYEFFGPVSSADGFVFLSGMVAGLVYGRMALRQQGSTAETRILHRVRELYLINVLCIAALAAGPLLLGGATTGMSANPYYQHPGKTLLFGALQLALPSFLDILPIYCYFLLILLPTLRLLQRGKVGVVLGLSTAVWLLGQLGPFHWIERLLNSTFSPALPFNLGFFDVFAWQFPFVGGVILGYLKAADRLPRLLQRPSRPLFALAFLTSVLLFLARHHLVPYLPEIIVPLAKLRTFGPMRVVGLACLAYSLIVICRRFPRFFNFRPLVFLGQHSLYVYAFHTMLCYGLTALLAARLAATSVAVQVAALLMALATLWIPAGVHHAWRKRKRVRPPRTPIVPRQSSAGAA